MRLFRDPIVCLQTKLWLNLNKKNLFQSKKEFFRELNKKMKTRNQQAILPFHSYQIVRARSNWAKNSKHSFQKIKTKHPNNEDDEPNLAFEFNKTSIYHI